jgi:hypothetical protein
MKKLGGQKAHLTVNGIFHIAFISMLSFFIFSSPGYGSTDILVEVNTTPVAIEAAALFASLGGGSGLNYQGIFSSVTGDIGNTAASTFVTGFNDEEAVYSETLFDIETVNGTKHTARTQCQKDSCSL